MFVEPSVETREDAAKRETADGSPAELPVFVARPRGERGEARPGLLLIQEAFGVNDHIRDVAQRFARQGYVVVSPDLYYRVGPWTTFRYDQPAADRQPATATLTAERAVGDLRAALGYLGALPGVDSSRIGVVGYCMGGRLSFVTAAWLPDRVKAAAVYYGGRIVADPDPAWPVAPVDQAGEIRCPVIAFFGGLDKSIPREHVERIDAALAAARVDRQVFLYPEADHGFFCDARPSYHPRAAQDAWHRTLGFFRERLGPVPPVDWSA